MKPAVLISDPDAGNYRPKFVADDAMPLAGLRLTDEVKAALHLTEPLPERIEVVHNGPEGAFNVIYNISHPLAAIRHHYLVPYYSPKDDDINHGTLEERNEELSVDRALQLMYLSEPEINKLNTKAELDAEFRLWHELPEETLYDRNYKASRFRVLAGAVVSRFDLLARIVGQKNTEGAMNIEYDHLKNVDPIPAEEIAKLRQEFIDLYVKVTGPDYMPLFRMIRLSDKNFDYNGVLIDLVREIGKPINIKTEKQEEFIRGHIVHKIGDAMHSIDQLHDLVVKTITQGKSSELFEKSLAGFFGNTGPDSYNVTNVDQVVKKLDEFAALCRARCGTPRPDPEYNHIYAAKSSLYHFFEGANGLLKNMNAETENGLLDPRVIEMRELLDRALRLMNRTSNTRTPCNISAPEPWIPNMSDDTPIMEKHMVHMFMGKGEYMRAREIIREAATMPAKSDDPAIESKTAFLKRHFCSVGRLTTELELLEQKIANPGIDRSSSSGRP